MIQSITIVIKEDKYDVVMCGENPTVHLSGKFKGKLNPHYLRHADQMLQSALRHTINSFFRDSIGIEEG